MPRKPKIDAGQKQEKTLEKMAFLTLFYLAFSVIFTSIQLVVFRVADLMLPFKMLVIMGFMYLYVNTLLSVYYHIKENRFNNPQMLCLKGLSVIAAFASTLYSLPSTIMLRNIVSFPFIIDIQFIIAFGVGIFAASAGMILAAKRSL